MKEKLLAFISKKNKSIAATVATAVVALAAKYKFDVDANAVGIIVAALLVGLTTYGAPKNVTKGE